MHVKIEKNPELGFSISGGVGGRGNPFHPDDNVCVSLHNCTVMSLTVSYRITDTFTTRNRSFLIFTNQTKIMLLG